VAEVLHRLRSTARRLKPRLRRLHHPLLPALAAAVLSQALLVNLLRPLLPARPQVAATEPADDTPELLRLGTRLHPQFGGGPSLGQPITLPLPPPPPPPPDLRESAAAQPAPSTVAPPASVPAPKPARSVPATTAVRPATRPSPSGASAGRPATAAGPASEPGSTGASPSLPKQPGAALELARAIAEGAASVPNDGATQAMAAQQRRQIWLDPAQQRQLQRVWERGEASDPPGDWGPLPDGTQVRKVGRTGLGSLADGEARARSLVSRQHITVLWPQGQQLWLLRLPLPATERN
jgi:hypothetical protein